MFRVALIPRSRGLCLGKCINTPLSAVIRAQTGVVLSLAVWHPVLVAGPVGMILLCSIGGIIPALKAYRLAVAETLAPTS